MIQISYRFPALKFWISLGNFSKISPMSNIKNLVFGSVLSQLNPYWQILENSSRNFSEISVFRGVTQTDFWKTHPVFFRNFNYRAWAGPMSPITYKLWVLWHILIWNIRRRNVSENSKIWIILNWKHRRNFKFFKSLK